ncbi:MAG TPA: TolC family protein [Gemmatimonadaceae bacterium]
MSSVSVRGMVHSAEARIGRVGAALLLTLLALAICAGNVSAQQRSGGTVTLSLDEALRMAQTQSQAIDIAKAGVNRATGQRLQARSQYFPQLSASAGYGRTLQSQFSGFASAAATPPDTTPQPVASQTLCTPFVPANATAAERQAALAQAATCPAASGGAGFDLSKTSFGAKNQYQAALNFSQTIYSGGRIQAQSAAADAQVRSAEIDVSAQRAQTSLDVTSAYYDAVLADQLSSIADSALAQTEVVLQQTRVARQVGNASEYDLLRAQVTRDNQLPQRIQVRANQQNAYLRLKQLLNLPLDDSLRLTTRIEENGPALPGIASEAKPDTAARDRAPVRQLDEAIRAQEQQIKIARSQRIPSLAIVSNYQRLYFPINTFPTLNAGVNNWTVGLSTSFPVLDGGRIKGDIAVAQAGLAQARAQREQARQFAALDSRVALTALQEAEASWEASRGTAEQAQRTYAIDEVRFREGISTQTDLSQSRLLLEQARANRAMAARNLAVARVRLALLRDLPLQTSAGAAGQAAQQQQQLQQAQQQLNSSNTTAARGGSTGGIQP